MNTIHPILSRADGSAGSGSSGTTTTGLPTSQGLNNMFLQLAERGVLNRIVSLADIPTHIVHAVSRRRKPA